MFTILNWFWMYLTYLKSCLFFHLFFHDPVIQSVRIKILKKKDVYVLVLANENHGLERKISPEKVPAEGVVQRYDLKGKSRKQTLGAVRKGVMIGNGLELGYNMPWLTISFTFFLGFSRYRLIWIDYMGLYKNIYRKDRFETLKFLDKLDKTDWLDKIDSWIDKIGIDADVITPNVVRGWCHEARLPRGLL